MAKTARRLRALRANQAPKSVKIKTKKAAAKRFNVLGSGKVKVAKANRGHFTGWRSASRQNRLSKDAIVVKSMMRHVRRLLPNSF